MEITKYWRQSVVSSSTNMLDIHIAVEVTEDMHQSEQKTNMLVMGNCAAAIGNNYMDIFDL